MEKRTVQGFTPIGVLTDAIVAELAAQRDRDKKAKEDGSDAGVREDFLSGDDGDAVGGRIHGGAPAGNGILVTRSEHKEEVKKVDEQEQTREPPEEQEESPPRRFGPRLSVRVAPHFEQASERGSRVHWDHPDGSFKKNIEEKEEKGNVHDT